MRIDRLFNALVLGGASIGAGCGNDGPSDDTHRSGSSQGGEDSEGGSGGTGGASTSGGTGNEGGAATSGGSGSTVPGGSGGSSSGGGGAGGVATGGTAGGSEPGPTTDAGDVAQGECSTEPDPSDPCGCPCCWMSDCANDEPCCESFCASGDDGNGCCGP